MAYGKIKADTLVYDNSGSDVEVTLSSLGNKANLASPTFTGTVTIPTPTAGDNTTKAASTAFVVAGFAPKASPAFTGTINGAALTLSGDLTVQGTTTTISSTTIDVADKNIELGKVSTPTDTTADGGGITLKGASDKEIKWVNATDAWTFNQDIEVTTGDITIKAGDGLNATLHIFADRGDDNADKWRLESNVTGEFKIQQYSSGSWATPFTLNGSNNATFAGTVSDSKGELRTIPLGNITSHHTLVAADAGKSFTSTAGVTFPNSVFTAGQAITIINNSASDITLTQGSGATLYNTADGATGNRTLAARGMATALYVSASVAYLSGAGLS